MAGTLLKNGRANLFLHSVDQTQLWNKETEIPLTIIGTVPMCRSIFTLTIGERERNPGVAQTWAQKQGCLTLDWKSVSPLLRLIHQSPRLCQRPKQIFLITYDIKDLAGGLGLIRLLRHLILRTYSTVSATNLLIFGYKSGCSDWGLKLKN